MYPAILVLAGMAVTSCGTTLTLEEPVSAVIDVRPNDTLTITANSDLDSRIARQVYRKLEPSGFYRIQPSLNTSSHGPDVHLRLSSSYLTTSTATPISMMKTTTGTTTHPRSHPKTSEAMLPAVSLFKTTTPTTEQTLPPPAKTPSINLPTKSHTIFCRGNTPTPSPLTRIVPIRSSNRPPKRARPGTGRSVNSSPNRPSPTNRNPQKPFFYKESSNDIRIT